MEFLELGPLRSHLLAVGSLQLSLVASSLRQTATRGQLAMMLHTHFRSSRVHVPTLSRAALNYECKVARAHAKVARAHDRVCRGLATPLKLATQYQPRPFYRSFTKPPEGFFCHF